ncbi:hypothetical protein ACO0LL_25895 [Undibacterium sp. TC4M20W]|uniref:hypothetical protein n=1 Tax=Undibacterium sp. TC4M20W TaxID=3413052 RepID=UPI003BEFB163
MRTSLIAIYWMDLGLSTEIKKNEEFHVFQSMLQIIFPNLKAESLFEKPSKRRFQFISKDWCDTVSIECEETSIPTLALYLWERCSIIKDEIQCDISEDMLTDLRKIISSVSGRIAILPRRAFDQIKVDKKKRAWENMIFLGTEANIYIFLQSETRKLFDTEIKQFDENNRHAQLFYLNTIQKNLDNQMLVEILFADEEKFIENCKKK